MSGTKIAKTVLSLYSYNTQGQFRNPTLSDTVTRDTIGFITVHETSFYIFQDMDSKAFKGESQLFKTFHWKKKNCSI